MAASEPLCAHMYTRYTEETAPQSFAIVFACFNNDVTTVQELIKDTPFSAVELLQCVMRKGISGKWRLPMMNVFEFLLSRVTPEEINEPFIAYTGEKHTLLTWFCYTVMSSHHTLLYNEKLAALVMQGADLHQEVNHKTGASYLVQHYNIDYLKVYMELGGKYTEGHLLVNSISTLSEKKYQNWIQQFVHNDSSYIPQIVHSPSSNNEMFSYLLNVCKLDPNEIDPSTGMNTLIAVCSEGSYRRLNMVLERFNGLLHLDIDTKTQEGTTAMDWALRHSTDIADRLNVFIHVKRIELNEVLHEEYNILHDKLGFHIPAVKQTIMDFITA
jgi:hypothetical protein